MSTAPASSEQPGPGLLELYDVALPQVLGYLVPRCDSRATAEDLTAETFLAAARVERAGERGQRPALSTPYLIGIARHKLVDHWRRQEREQRLLRVAYDEQPTEHDPWDAKLDAVLAHQVLARLGGHHRAALTLRYLDGLAVPEVADVLGRTTQATEALLVRARAAFRRQCTEEAGDA